MRGLDRYGEPSSYFGPGGLAEAEALCAAANRDVHGFLLPTGPTPAANIERGPVLLRGRRVIRSWSFDSPLPSGNADNDRVQLRLFSRSDTPPGERVVLFHHPVYQRLYRLWEHFLAPLADRVPVAMMAAPWQFERAGSTRFPGEGTINPNPYRLYEALRQWCHDHHATVQLLESEARLRVVAEIGYSMGGFQTLMLAGAGGIDVPLVTISATNRYAWGLWNGVMAHHLNAGMRAVGIDYERLHTMTRELEAERHVAPLRGRSTMYVYGARDLVDPYPSLERLRDALQPTRTLCFPWTGHAGVSFRRSHVISGVHGFLQASGALGSSTAPARDRSVARA